MSLVADSFFEINSWGTNDLINGFRIAVVVASGALIAPMIVVAKRTKSLGFLSLAVMLLVTSLTETDDLNEPFIIYVLPLHMIAVALAGVWMWKRSHPDYVLTSSKG